MEAASDLHAELCSMLVKVRDFQKDHLNVVTGTSRKNYWKLCMYQEKKGRDHAILCADSNGADRKWNVLDKSNAIKVLEASGGDLIVELVPVPDDDDGRRVILSKFPIDFAALCRKKGKRLATNDENALPVTRIRLVHGDEKYPPLVAVLTLHRDKKKEAYEIVGLQTESTWATSQDFYLKLQSDLLYVSETLIRAESNVRHQIHQLQQTLEKSVESMQDLISAPGRFKRDTEVLENNAKVQASKRICRAIIE